MMRRRPMVLVALLFVVAALPATHARSETPAGFPDTGQSAKDFQLPAVVGELSGQVSLKQAISDGPVVLVVLRGYPGYQCPICSRQVAGLIQKADAFREKNARVLLVYPGPDEELTERAKEFIKGTELPVPITLLVDPGYKFTGAFGLRWDAPRETAYPSTFVIDQDGKIRFAKISKTHGGRTTADEILAEL